MKVNRKFLDKTAKSLSVLFAEDTAVVHISGSESNYGHILNANQGLSKVFGYNRKEVINHSVNILMPVSFGRRHNEFLDKFFKTGHEIVFNKEHVFYGLNKNGFCFCIKILIKQMPQLVEGIQYIGMMRQTHNEYEYILTDLSGRIECFSTGVTSILGISPSFVKENAINIQIFAPDLIAVLSAANRKELLSSFQRAGGQRLTFIVPKDFTNYAKPTTKKAKNAEPGSKMVVNQAVYHEVNKSLNKENGIIKSQITPQTLLQSYEYRECDMKQTTQCEIVDSVYAEDYRDAEPLRIRVFKLSKMEMKSEDLVDVNSEEHIAFAEANKEASEPKENSESFAPVVNHTKLDSVSLSVKDVRNLREETKGTEKLPGHIITTERQTELLETKMLIHPSNTSSNIDVEDRQEEENSTPKASIGMLRGPKNSAKEIEPPNKEELFDNSVQEKINSKWIKNRPKLEKCGRANSERVIKFAGRNKSFIQYSKSSDKRLEIRTGGRLTTFKEQNDRNKQTARVKTKEVNEAEIRTQKLKSENFDSPFYNLNEDRKIEPDASEIKLFSERTELIGEPIRSTEEKDVSVRELLQERASQKNLNQDKSNKILQMSQFKKDNQSQIITDVKFDPEQMEYPEYKLTEDELKLRHSLLAATNAKNKKKEVKVESPKHKVDDEEDSKEAKDEEKDSAEESSEEKAEEELNTQESTSNASTEAAKRSLYTLRAAIDEEFIPSSLRNMSHIANFVFLIILGYAIGYFATEIFLYKRSQCNVKKLDLAEVRIKSLVNIDLHVLNMIIIAADYRQHTFQGITDPSDSFIYQDLDYTTLTFDDIKGRLKSEAIAMKYAQTELSVNSSCTSEDAMMVINLDSILVNCMEVPGLPTEFYYTTWQAMMEFIVATYRIASLDLVVVNEFNETTVYFVVMNALHNVLTSLNMASGAIMQEINDQQKRAMKIFVILLSLASTLLVFSTVLLIPVVNKVNKNKQEVLELFMHVRKSTANEEMNKCRKFLGAFQANQEAEFIGNEGEEGQQDEENADVTIDKIKIAEKNKNLGASRRKFKRLVLNLGIVLFKFIFLILIMEGYFVLSYVLSNTYFNQLIALAGEMDCLVKRYPDNTLLLLIQKYCIMEW